MNRLAFAMIGILALAGCQASGGAGGGATTTKAEPAAPPKTTLQKAVAAQSDGPAASPIKEQSVEVVFLDSIAFDSDVSASMWEQNREIVIKPTSPFTLNEIPPRLEKWLSVIKESGGQVKAKELPPKTQLAMRGIVGALIDIVVAIFGAVQEQATYGAAKYYDATLEYRKETGVERIVFSHR
jgi:hypothetical protein